MHLATIGTQPDQTMRSRITLLMIGLPTTAPHDGRSSLPSRASRGGRAFGASSWIRIQAVLALLLLAACATDGGGAASTAPVPVVSAPARLAERLPARAGSFQRGSSAALDQPLPGVEVSYATAGRSAAGFVQVLRPPAAAPPDGPGSPLVQEEYQRDLSVAQRGSGPHRRLRLLQESDQPPGAPLFRCAELEGTYGRTAVTSTTCVGAAGGQLLRLRISMPRRDPPLADPRAFIREITAALRAPGG